MSSEPLRAVLDHLSEVVDRVEREHERVTITRDGRQAAVLISPDDLAGLEETLAVLSDAAALAEIRQADAAYAKEASNEPGAFVAVCGRSAGRRPPLSSDLDEVSSGTPRSPEIRDPGVRQLPNSGNPRPRGFPDVGPAVGDAGQG